MVSYQSVENATNTTPRCGSTAMKVTSAKKPEQSSPPSVPTARGPPRLVALGIMAWLSRPKRKRPAA